MVNTQANILKNTIKEFLKDNTSQFDHTNLARVMYDWLDATDWNDVEKVARFIVNEIPPKP